MTTTTLGVFTEIENVDMLNANDGVAVAASTGPGVNRYYLVHTEDAGNTWSTIAPLPLNSFVGNQPFSVPTLNFVSRNLGYVQAYQDSIYVTNDGGTSWKKLVTAGIWPNFAIAGSTITVTSDVCSEPIPNYGPLKCPSELALYHLDATKPFSSHLVPKMGATNYRAVVVLTALSSRSDVVVEGGGEGTASSILDTNDAGVSWTLLADPCEHITIDQLLNPGQRHWLLNCYLDGGMNQGAHQLWQSNDHGLRWSIVAKSNEEVGNVVGNIVDTSSSLLLSGNKKILFGLVGGAGGGVTFSTNGGSRWSATTVNGFDGAPAIESTFGSTGSVVTVEGGPIYLTSNGITWSKVSPLPVGHDPVSSLCSGENDVVAKVARTGAAGGTSYVTILFKELGPPACWLSGIPRVQPVAGSRDVPVGRVATKIRVAGRGRKTMLGQSGGEASVTVGIETAANYTKSSCQPKNMNRLQIEFNQTSFFVTIGVNEVCTKIRSTNVAGVVAGIVGGP